MKIMRVVFIAVILCSIMISCGKKERPAAGNDISNELEAGLKDFENRKKYSSFTPEILKSIPDEKLEMAVIDYIIDIWLKGCGEEESAAVKKLSPGFRNIYITWALDGEVNNGGFIQFFYNTSGAYNDELASALHDIGAFKTEKIAIEAISVYNKERALHQKVKKDGTMKSFMSSYGESGLGRLDDLFYNSGEDLGNLRIKYIRENTEQFITR